MVVLVLVPWIPCAAQPAESGQSDRRARDRAQQAGRAARAAARRLTPSVGLWNVVLSVTSANLFATLVWLLETAISKTMFSGAVAPLALVLHEAASEATASRW
jgi:hypothetical protein